jgi:hydrogenase nickel incorporation protein HypB
MSKVRLIKIKEEILSDNRNLAGSVRQRLTESKTCLLNLMSSPGSGKTSLILKTIELLREKAQIAVVEADLDSTVDADKIAAVGVPAVQIETGGFCHVNAAMCEKALESLGIRDLDLVILENVGNLVCPAESDTGAHLNVVILSVPEGDDKPLKYPMIFQGVDAVVLNKVDYLQIADFDKDAFFRHVKVLNSGAALFEVSCTTGEGLDAWASWVTDRLP